MKYEIKRVNNAPLLYRYGELALPNAGIPTNSELEFWHRIEFLEGVLKRIAQEDPTDSQLQELVTHALDRNR